MDSVICAGLAVLAWTDALQALVRVHCTCTGTRIMPGDLARAADPCPRCRGARVIGRGARGTVVAVCTPDTGPVAVKVGAAHDMAAEKSLLLAAGSGTCEGVVPVLSRRDVCEAGPWFAMPLVVDAGAVPSTLAQWLKNMRGDVMPGEFVLQRVVSLARAVAHVHSMHMVHRDIKPENVLVQGARTMLCDFDQSQMLGAWKGVVRCAKGGGTLGFASPEQVVGWAARDRRGVLHVVHNLTQASDVWSVGVILVAVALGTGDRVMQTAQALCTEAAARAKALVAGDTSLLTVEDLNHHLQVLRWSLARELRHLFLTFVCCHQWRFALQLAAIAEACLTADPAARPAAADVARRLALCPPSRPDSCRHGHSPPSLPMVLPAAQVGDVAVARVLARLRAAVAAGNTRMTVRDVDGAALAVAVAAATAGGVRYVLLPPSPWVRNVRQWLASAMGLSAAAVAAASNPRMVCVVDACRWWHGDLGRLTKACEDVVETLRGVATVVTVLCLPCNVRGAEGDGAACWARAQEAGLCDGDVEVDSLGIPMARRCATEDVRVMQAVVGARRACRMLDTYGRQVVRAEMAQDAAALGAALAAYDASGSATLVNEAACTLGTEAVDEPAWGCVRLEWALGLPACGVAAHWLVYSRHSVVLMKHVWEAAWITGLQMLLHVNTQPALPDTLARCMASLCSLLAVGWLYVWSGTPMVCCDGHRLCLRGMRRLWRLRWDKCAWPQRRLPLA